MSLGYDDESLSEAYISLSVRGQKKDVVPQYTEIKCISRQTLEEIRLSKKAYATLTSLHSCNSIR